MYTFAKPLCTFLGPHLVLSAQDANADVERLSSLVRARDALLVVAPVGVLERVVDDLSGKQALIEANRQVQRHIGVFITALVEVEVDSERNL